MFAPYRGRNSYLAAAGRTAGAFVRNTGQFLANKAAWAGATAAAAGAYGAMKGSNRGIPRVARRAPARRAPMRRTRNVKPKASLQRQVTALKQQVNTQMGTYTQKLRTYLAAISANANECDYASISFNSNTVLAAVIDAVKYFNPAAPGTLVSVDMTAPTFQQQIRFTKSFGKISIRNNYSVPCRATMYMLRCKVDTSITPETAIAASCTDETNSSIVSPLIFPSDCHQFNDLWSIVSSKSVYLKPGDESSLSHSYPAFNFDPALDDDHGLSYQKHYHGSIMMVRVEGVIAHGSTSGMTHSKAGVDVVYDQIHTVKYPAGVNVNYIEISDSPITVVGTLQVSQPEAEQATYAL